MNVLYVLVACILLKIKQTNKKLRVFVLCTKTKLFSLNNTSTFCPFISFITQAKLWLEFPKEICMQLLINFDYIVST